MPSSFHAGGHIIRSKGRLILREFPITGLYQIATTNGTGEIICSSNDGTARFLTMETGGVTLMSNGAVLNVNPTNIDTFQNRNVRCGDSEFYLYLSESSSEFFLHTDEELYYLFQTAQT